MIIMHGSLLDCICLDNKRMIDEKEEIIEGMGLLVDVYGLDNGLLFDGNLGLLVKGLAHSSMDRCFCLVDIILR
jgi:hypothetical protein